jgi:hypothetical protein
MDLQLTLGRGNFVRFPWIYFQRIAQCARYRFEGGFCDVVAIDAVQLINV